MRPIRSFVSIIWCRCRPNQRRERTGSILVSIAEKPTDRETERRTYRRPINECERGRTRTRASEHRCSEGAAALHHVLACSNSAALALAKESCGAERPRGLATEGAAEPEELAPPYSSDEVGDGPPLLLPLPRSCGNTNSLAGSATAAGAGAGAGAAGAAVDPGPSASMLNKQKVRVGRASERARRRIGSVRPVAPDWLVDGQQLHDTRLSEWGRSEARERESERDHTTALAHARTRTWPTLRSLEWRSFHRRRSAVCASDEARPVSRTAVSLHGHMTSRTYRDRVAGGERRERVRGLDHMCDGGGVVHVAQAAMRHRAEHARGRRRR